MNIKQNRAMSFVMITLIYILAAVVGIAVYRRLAYSLWLNLLIADIVATVVTFVFSVLFKNASVYDPYWSVQPIVILCAFAVGQRMTLVKVLLLIAVCVWGGRLTANWAYTFHGLTHQDWRYTMLREKTGLFYPIVNFVGIHLVPTLVVYACILPAVEVMRSHAVGGKGSVLFFCLSMGAVLLQGASDYQMHRFRRQKTGGFLRAGLWTHSRHPNYLGEILMWWGVALASINALNGQWYLTTGAIANTLLFFCVSIPLADGRQSQKEGFEEYKKQTRMLLPIKR